MRIKIKAKAKRINSLLKGSDPFEASLAQGIASVEARLKELAKQSRVFWKDFKIMTQAYDNLLTPLETALTIRNEGGSGMPVPAPDSDSELD